MQKANKLRFFAVAGCCLWLIFSSKVQADSTGSSTDNSTAHGNTPLRVAAASDLRDALSAVTAQFRQQHPDMPVELVFGSSGKLSQQIQHGAPFALYIAADRSYADQLWQQGFAEQAPVLLAKGHLVLVTRQGLLAAKIWLNWHSPASVILLLPSQRMPLMATEPDRRCTIKACGNS